MIVIKQHEGSAWRVLQGESTQMHDIAMFMQATLVVTSFLLTCFYAVQKCRNRCKGEVIFVSTATFVIYGAIVLTGNSLTWVRIDSIESNITREIPLGRYFAWLVTCPVIIMQLAKLHAQVGYKVAHSSENFYVILDQIMIVSGAFGAVMEGAAKWIFFILGVAAGAGLFTHLYIVFRDNHKNFSNQVKPYMIVAAVLYFFSWAIYPAMWILGSPGLGIASNDVDTIVHCIGDLIAKNLFGCFCWYVRWNLLEEQSAYQVDKILTSKGSSSAGVDQMAMGLTDEEMKNAKSLPYKVLLLTEDRVVKKVITMILQKLKVQVRVFSRPEEASKYIDAQSLLEIDAVLIAPSHHQRDESYQLGELAKFLCRDPYKIPLLGMYFDKAAHENPSYANYIHGIIRRPLDEIAFHEDLYQWRLTACMWRKVATTMDSIEDYSGNGAVNDFLERQNLASSQQNGRADSFFSLGGSSPRKSPRRESIETQGKTGAIYETTTAEISQEGVRQDHFLF